MSSPDSACSSGFDSPSPEVSDCHVFPEVQRIESQPDDAGRLVARLPQHHQDVGQCLVELPRKIVTDNPTGFVLPHLTGDKKQTTALAYWAR